jgi:hypothetical protein
MAQLFRVPLARSTLICVQASDLCRFLISTPTLAASALYSLMGALAWPDSLSFRRAIEILNRIVPLLTGN